MGTGFLLYLITRMDAIKSLLGTSGTLMLFGSAVLIAVFGIGSTVDEDDAWARAVWIRIKKPVKIVFLVSVALIAINTFLPTTGDLALIVGTDKLAASPEFQQIINGAIHAIMKAIGGS